MLQILKKILDFFLDTKWDTEQYQILSQIPKSFADTKSSISDTKMVTLPRLHIFTECLVTRKYHLCLQKYIKGLFTLAFLPQRKRWRFGHSFYVCRHGCIWQPRQANPCTLGRDVLKNRTFSIFQTASPQGFPLNLPCLNLYLWQKTCTSMAKTPNKNAEQKRQCKRPLISSKQSSL